ncbi:unnamed protein product [Adineta ricciae]|uniref:EF-hand domain-containing protein n=1 Tax=Adineta ricciae TaxID=249248 RepID=A0A814PC28_ADIRI|nr:unnamed protein product [Adineta ricciae]CAF1435454.1 unnamed protein product [Adineta ricciae]
MDSVSIEETFRLGKRIDFSSPCVMSSRKSTARRTFVAKKRTFKVSFTANVIRPKYLIPKMPRGLGNFDNTIVLCVFCNAPCFEDYLHCDVCIKTYHYQCRHNPGDDESALLPSRRKKYHNCTECEDLTQLLSEDDIHLLRSSFERIDRDNDGFIILKDFLMFCFNTKMMISLIPYDLYIQKLHFYIMDIQQKGRVAWLDYQRFYTCKLIAGKDHAQLTTSLTYKELIFAKKLFLQDSELNFDHQRNLIITKEHSDRVLYDLLVMIKRKYGGQFIDAVLYENPIIDEAFEAHRVLTWEEFLCQISIPIILNRSNFDIQQFQTYLASILPPVIETKVEFSYTHRLKTQVIATEDVSFIQSCVKYRKATKHRSKSALPRGTLIVENMEGKDNFERPKLKLNIRDERQTISAPWSMVKQMELLRNEPILI